MVIGLGFSDMLSLAQTIGIVGTMVLTLYFSKKQIQSLSIDQQTRVLNDLDEKFHNISRQKQSWFFHELSWYWRGLDATGYDGQGCNQFTGCVQECRFFTEYGRIEDEEVIELSLIGRRTL